MSDETQLPSDFIRDDDGFERIEKFQTLEAGQYWRAVKEIDDIPVDEVILIQSIDWVDGLPHTIHMRGHPRTYRSYGSKGNVSTYKFIANEFLDHFEHEPNYKEIRAKELSAVQGKVAELQGELIRAQSDPQFLESMIHEALLIEQKKAGNEDKQLPAVQMMIGQNIPSDVTDVISSGLTEDTVLSLRAKAETQHMVANVTANWMKEKTKEIAETITKMTPFFEEQAAVAIAQTEEVRRHMDKVIDGIASLDLYIGKDVHVETIKTGESAPDGEPLTLMQQVLRMDEEMAVHVDVNEDFDFSSYSKFIDYLKSSPSLLNQILPAQRGVVALYPTNRHLQYSDNALVNSLMNQRNRLTFLLVRNGENLHIVNSSVESHSSFTLLFPRKNDTDNVFRGIDGRQIKFDDLSYTGKLKEHERMALHYKRFLILLCGLDHRLDLFGKFYEGPKDFNFVSQEFQSKYFRFANDADSAYQLATDNQMKYPAVSKWIDEMNSKMRSGSRIAVRWTDVIDNEMGTAPGYYRSYDTRLKRDAEITIVRREANNFIVDANVENGRLERSESTVKVNLSKFHKWGSEFGYLCLDFVEPEDLEHYIFDRESRVNHIGYIRLFKQALEFIRQERLEEAETRERLAEAAIIGGLSTKDEVKGLVNATVAGWRASKRGEKLPAADMSTATWKELLDQMYNISDSSGSKIDAIKHQLSELGRKTIRITSKNGHFFVYVEPLDSERDDRLFEHPWAMRLKAVPLASGKISFKNESWVLFDDLISEQVIFDDEELSEKWKSTIRIPYSEWVGAIEKINQAHKKLDYLLKVDHESILHRFDEFLEFRRKVSKKFVASIAYNVPIGLAVSDKKLQMITLACDAMHILAKLAQTDTQKSWIRKQFLSIYADKISNALSIDDALNGRIHDKEYRAFKLVWSLAADFTEMSTNGFHASSCSIDFHYDFPDRKTLWSSSFPMKNGQPDFTGLLPIDFEATKDQVVLYSLHYDDDDFLAYVIKPFNKVFSFQDAADYVYKKAGMKRGCRHYKTLGKYSNKAEAQSIIFNKIDSHPLLEYGFIDAKFFENFEETPLFNEDNLVVFKKKPAPQNGMKP